MKHILEYPVSFTLNSAVNKLALDLQIKSGTTADFIDSKVIGLVDLQIRFSTQPSAIQIAEIETVLSAHKGEKPLFDEEFVNEREGKIRDMTELAISHPLLDGLETEEVLVELDNYLNAWKRSGRNTVLVNKLIADASNLEHPRYAFYNQIVNDAGNKTFEYFISVVS